MLSKRLNSGLRRLGYQVISSEIPAEQSGIVGVLVPDPPHFYSFLRGSGIRASLMDAGIIRFSLHAYNLEWEVDRILDIAGKYEKKTVKAT
jgi:selenocysteine lyase/cysteine desulfurase